MLALIFSLKNCLFGTAKLVRNTIKSKFIFNGNGIAFDGQGQWTFVNDCDRNFAIFDVGNSLSSHTDNRKNNHLVLDEGPTDDIALSQQKEKSINFSKANTKFCLFLHYNDDESYVSVNKTKI